VSTKTFNLNSTLLSCIDGDARLKVLSIGKQVQPGAASAAVLTIDATPDLWNVRKREHS
jgi:hypothetical protein